MECWGNKNSVNVFGMRAGLGYFKKRNESCERSEEQQERHTVKECNVANTGRWNHCNVAFAEC